MAATNLTVKSLLSLKQICGRWTFLFSFFMLPAFLQAQGLPSVDDTVANASRMEGYFNLYWEESSGKMYWEIDKLDTEFLYQISNNQEQQELFLLYTIFQMEKFGQWKKLLKEKKS